MKSMRKGKEKEKKVEKSLINENVNITQITAALSLFRKHQSEHAFLIVEYFNERGEEIIRKQAHFYHRQPKLIYKRVQDQNDFFERWLLQWKSNLQNRHYYLLAFLPRAGWFFCGWHGNGKLIEGVINILECSVNGFDKLHRYLQKINSENFEEKRKKEVTEIIAKVLNFKKNKGIIVYREIDKHILFDDSAGASTYTWTVDRKKVHRFELYIKWWQQQDVEYLLAGNTVLNQLIGSSLIYQIQNKGHNCLSWAYSVIRMLHLRVNSSFKRSLHTTSYHPKIDLPAQQKKADLLVQQDMIEREKQKEQVMRIQSQIKFSKDPAELHHFYEINSTLVKQYRINQTNWLVAHISVGSLVAGHSMLVVEGIRLRKKRESNKPFPRLFVGYYHLVVPPGAKNGIVLIEEYNYHRYQKHYRQFFTKSWPVKKEIVWKKLIEPLHQQEGCLVPYRMATAKLKTLDDDGETILQKHNCTTWALEQLHTIGIQDPIKIVSRLKGIDKPFKQTKNIASNSRCILSLF